MNQNEALQNLINGVEKGQAKGIFSLEESALLWSSIQAFFPPVESAEFSTPAQAITPEPAKPEKPKK